MTDNEIIKALENIMNEKIGCCKEDCNFYDGKVHGCAQTIAKHSLDLINRQKAENLSLQNKVELLEQAMKMLKEDSDKSRESAMEVIQKQEAEIERLQTENRILSQKRMNLFERLEFIHKARAEAVKEFAERLKENVESYDVATGYKITIVHAVEEETIDNLVKEMVGESSV